VEVAQIQWIVLRHRAQGTGRRAQDKIYEIPLPGGARGGFLINNICRKYL